MNGSCKIREGVASKKEAMERVKVSEWKSAHHAKQYTKEMAAASLVSDFFRPPKIKNIPREAEAHPQRKCCN